MAFNPNEHIAKIQGREYLEVKWRLVWFRDVMPGGGVHTEIVNADPVVVKATVISPDGMVLATAHGSADDGGKSVVWKGRAIEKAETAAIGRALAHAGFGTQFTEDDESGVVDSPVNRPAPQAPAPAPETVDFIADKVDVREYEGKRYWVFYDANGRHKASTYNEKLAAIAGDAVVNVKPGATVEIDAIIGARLKTRPNGSAVWEITAVTVQLAGANVPF